MYEKIGEKIKSLSKIIFIVEEIVIFIISILILASDDDLILIGLLVLFGGSFVAWVSALCMYGFGEIIDKVCDIERNTRGDIRKSEVQSKIDYERVSKIEKLRSEGLITEEEYKQAISKK